MQGFKGCDMKIGFYTDEKYKKFLLKEVALFSERDMKIDVVDDGAFIVDIKTGAFGVFDGRGKLIKSSLQLRGNKPNYTPPICLKAAVGGRSVIVMRCFWVMPIIILGIL